MVHNTITYEQLEETLRGLGYVSDPPNGNHVIFRHPETYLYVVLPRMSPQGEVSPIDLLSVRNAVANGGILPAEEFEKRLLLRRGRRLVKPLELWHAIIDAEAEYHNSHGRPARVLKLPVVLAYDLAKLRPKDLGPLADEVTRKGIKVFEEEGLLGVPVELVPGAGEFVFE